MNWLKSIWQAFLKWLQPQVITPPQPPHLSKIEPWALAIQHQEGGKINDRNTRNKNPGNLRYGSFTKSFGYIDIDSGNFLIFPDYTTGFHALTVFLSNACKGIYAPVYTPEMTLREFTSKYAEPPNDNYVNGVSSYLDVTPSISIKELL